MSYQAKHVLQESEVVVGYTTYIELIQDIIAPHQTVIRSHMKKEVERALEALEEAKAGKVVSVISSGDAGIYGMAGLILELLYKNNLEEYIEVEIVPGISAVQAAAARLGAPLMHDFACISLSDLLTPWQTIVKRIHHAAQGDFVIVLYNPKSKKRIEQIQEAVDILLQYKKTDTPVGIVKSAYREGEEVHISSLESLLEHEIDMFTTIIIGNQSTFMNKTHMITPRGYNIHE
ncbi:precorrin-3B C(17)-methyltransferase [Desulfuribacillus stibiiarsenatis]|uniref:Precorrin-3B C(17)-methyltransferase n=1 Tax=Desulfuribacillus stibiiarsenatis TaxID=1390249 RepID=A0A1E5L3N3_9FIRM|nr:precorrin-3B C(17)-methyltransferase [Desulfuribacillus stibiiarsenatis]OEH84758.1 precorrin-3B C(17)-methyltransferase [Desulfuribacillus stibiiarsenatis]